MDSAIPLLQNLTPETVWGIVPRIVGALYMLALGSLIPQIVNGVGSRGIAPIGQRLGRMKQDYPGLRRFFDQPTLFWFNSSDAFIQIVPIIGVCGGAMAVYGGELGFWGLLIAWVCMLSLDAMALMFPWDCFLLEMGFLALWFPAVPALPEVAAASAPLPLVSFAARLLIIRLMWGFARLKFWGTKKGDNMYLQGFFAWMPMVNPIGWLAQHGPKWFLKASYVFMWTVEVVVPALAFFSGDLRAIAAAGLAALMLGIWATGNWGYFNLGYGAMCFLLLDTQSSVLEWGGASFADNAVANSVMAFLIFGQVLYMPFNSWCSQTWLHWNYDDVAWNRPWLRGLIGLFRALAPFRVLNAYGVFPPNASPPVKIVPRFEGSDDGETWLPYEYRFMPTHAKSRPPFVAPHHPRLDQGIIYVGAGLNDSNYLSSIMGAGKPYAYSSFSHYGWIDRLMQRLLEGTPGAIKMFKTNPFPDPQRPPKWLRVCTVALTPTTVGEMRETGRWWHERRVHELYNARQSNEAVWKHWLPQPETFHPDSVDLKRRTPALQAMTRAYEGGMDAHEALLAGSDLSAEDVTRFWQEAVPFIQEQRYDWGNIEPRAAEMKQRFGEDTLHTFERILERYCILLRTRTEPHFYRKVEPKVELSSNFLFHLLLHEVVCDGRDAVNAMLADPSQAAARAQRMDDPQALYTAGLLRHETVMYHARSFRTIMAVTESPPWEVPGIMSMRDFLVTLNPSREFFIPKCEMGEPGHWQVQPFGGEEPSAAE